MSANDPADLDMQLDEDMEHRQERRDEDLHDAMDDNVDMELIDDTLDDDVEVDEDDLQDMRFAPSHAVPSSAADEVPPAPGEAAAATERGGSGFARRPQQMLRRFGADQGRRVGGSRGRTPDEPQRDENGKEPGGGRDNEGGKGGSSTPVDRVKIHNAAAVDIEKMCAAYSGSALVTRLDTVFEFCPPLARDAFIALTKYLKNSTQNTVKYASMYARLESASIVDVPPIDQHWLDSTSTTCSTRLDALLTELKRQKDEGVKESTRRAMEDLFHHYVSTGQLLEAIKLYNRGMRDYCTQMKHIIQMWVSWLEVTVNLGEWHRVEPLISQTERSLAEFEEWDKQAADSTGRPRVQMSSAHSSVASTNRATLNAGKAKLDAVVGVYLLQQKKYRQAVDRFLKIDADHLECPWLVAASDLAKYGALCALATLDRADIKGKCVDSSFRKMLEYEPQLIELVSHFNRSKFGPCFDLLDSLKDGLLLDPFFYGHVDGVFNAIRKRALCQYLKPFAVANLSTMAEVFRCGIDKLTTELICLMDEGALPDRKIDDHAKVIHTVVHDERILALQKVSTVCDELLERAEWVVLRALVQQGKLFVAHPSAAHGGDEGPRGGGGGGGGGRFGKRRTDDDGGAESSAQGMFRTTRNSLMRIVRPGAVADSSAREPIDVDP